MRTILLIATGGTIASRPTAAGGLAPAITSQELLSCVPELAEFCRIDTIQLYNLDSTNMGPEQWQGIAAAVQENEGLLVQPYTLTLKNGVVVKIEEKFYH